MYALYFIHAPSFGGVMAIFWNLFDRLTNHKPAAIRHLFCLSHEHNGKGEIEYMYREMIKQHPPPPRSVHGGRKDVDVRKVRPENGQERHHCT